MWVAEENKPDCGRHSTENSEEPFTIAYYVVNQQLAAFESAFPVAGGRLPIGSPFLARSL
jgi:hypothetical protein